MCAVAYRRSSYRRENIEKGFGCGASIGGRRAGTACQSSSLRMLWQDVHMRIISVPKRDCLRGPLSWRPTICRAHTGTLTGTGHSNQIYLRCVRVHMHRPLARHGPRGCYASAEQNGLHEAAAVGAQWVPRCDIVNGLEHPPAWTAPDTATRMFACHTAESASSCLAGRRRGDTSCKVGAVEGRAVHGARCRAGWTAAVRVTCLLSARWFARRTLLSGSASCRLFRSIAMMDEHSRQ